MRLFVAIRPDAAARDALLDVMDDTADFRWQDDEQLHLTLRFIGEVDRHQAQDVAVELARVRLAPFDLRLGQLGSFDDRRGGALWVGVEPREDIVRLAAKVDRACQVAGLEPERRAFKPHITVARWSGMRNREVRAFLADRTVEPRSFEVTRFGLYQSHLSRHGPTYRLAADFPLTR